MRFCTLIENTAGDNNCVFEHGLSVYAETKNHKVLIDAGQSNSFISNAKILNICLENVDVAILSHGHYDHSGGMIDFLQLNNHAMLYMQKSAFDEHYAVDPDTIRDIGIDQKLISKNNVRLVEGNFRIDDELSVFSGVEGKRYFSKSNLNLKVKYNDVLIQDDFRINIV